MYQWNCITCTPTGCYQCAHSTTTTNTHMKKYLPIEQQFELMDLRIAQVIEELDALLLLAEAQEDTDEHSDHA